MQFNRRVSGIVLFSSTMFEVGYLVLISTLLEWGIFKIIDMDALCHCVCSGLWAVSPPPVLTISHRHVQPTIPILFLICFAIFLIRYCTAWTFRFQTCQWFEICILSAIQQCSSLTFCLHLVDTTHTSRSLCDIGCWNLIRPHMNSSSLNL